MPTDAEQRTDEERELDKVLDDNWKSTDLTKTVLAAGYRKVPDDCVVVRRDDVENALIHAPFDMSVDEWVNRLSRAITDQTAT